LAKLTVRKDVVERFWPAFARSAFSIPTATCQVSWRRRTYCLLPLTHLSPSRLPGPQPRA